MNYSGAIKQLESEQTCDWSKDPDWIFDPNDDGLSTNYVIAKEVGGALAEGFGDRIEFGTFDNCREWGLTFTAGDWTFCCFEHRNSDQIMVEGCPTAELKTWGPYGCDTKWDMMWHAGWKQYQTVTQALTYAINAALAGDLMDRSHAIRVLRNEPVYQAGYRN